MTAIDISAVADFLLCRTPKAWVYVAVQQQNILLIDHANCEKKAASTALGLMYRYIHKYELLQKLSKLAREELRHFEQVIALMKKRGVVYEMLTASRYAASLQAFSRKTEPGRLVDAMIIGAIIEARSCERFAALAPFLDSVLQKFYLSLLQSESRHFNDYLALARCYADEVDENIDARIQFLLERERDLIESPDSKFRFHSGFPAF